MPDTKGGSGTGRNAGTGRGGETAKGENIWRGSAGEDALPLQWNLLFNVGLQPKGADSRDGGRNGTWHPFRPNRAEKARHEPEKWFCIQKSSLEKWVAFYSNRNRGCSPEPVAEAKDFCFASARCVF